MVNKTSPDPASRTLCERVTQLRRRNKFTLEQLAAASGVSRSMLSQIERGHANPTLAVTFRIAQAFGLTIGELVDDPQAVGLIDIVHGDDPGTLFRNDKQCRIRTLSPLHLEKSVEFYEIKLEVGASLDSAPHFEGTRELFTVARGTAEIHAGDTQCRLRTGDSAQYRADVIHRIENTGTEALLGYLVVTYR
jgi:transcriptional regulator with XRE-family HTH domain